MGWKSTQCHGRTSDRSRQNHCATEDMCLQEFPGPTASLQEQDIIACFKLPRLWGCTLLKQNSTHPASCRWYCEMGIRLDLEVGWQRRRENKMRSVLSLCLSLFWAWKNRTYFEASPVLSWWLDTVLLSLQLVATWEGKEKPCTQG